MISGYNSYSSINSPIAKENHSECIVKCTCKHASYTSLRSPKQQLQLSQVSSATYEKNVQKMSKISCDAATSPNRFSQRSPQVNLRISNGSASAYNELRISDEKTITAKTNISPRRLIATRNAATSPGLDKRKQLTSKQSEKFILKSQDTNKSILEKSNSLGESKPVRILRTTRSLSPRPPVPHQHAITVCDENDIISVKISPNEDFEEDSADAKSTKKKYKASSEQTSPSLSDHGTTFTYENLSTNRSTGCLVYVPSDPWMKMSDVDDIKFTRKDQRSPRKFTNEVRSLSRGNLLPLNDDPWIWRQTANGSKSRPTPSKSPKQEAYRQTKSFSITQFDPSDYAKSSTEKISSGKSTARPKLQRCKSPIVIDDESMPFLNDSSSTTSTALGCTCNASPDKQQPNLLSPRKDIGNKEILCTTASVAASSTAAASQSKSFLNVTNSNVVQSRHSFSSASQKDDELQLNIRRLSEQIKKPVKNSVISNCSGADFTDYLNRFRMTEAEKAKAAAAAANAITTRNNSKTPTETVLETTC